MKKIIGFLLIIALCIPALFACDSVKDSLPSEIPQVTPEGTEKEKEISDVAKVAKMYEVSQPTKVVATTKQVLVKDILELNCSYEMVTGYINGAPAYTFESSTESIRTVEEGGKNDEVKPIKVPTTVLEEYIEGFGLRVSTTVDGQTAVGNWDNNPELETKSIGKGKMAINLKDKYVKNVEYEDGVLSFTIPSSKVSTVLGKTYAKYISGDVKVVITNDGAQITSIELEYTIAGDTGSHVVDSKMYVKVEYSYDIEKITID